VSTTNGNTHGAGGTSAGEPEHQREVVVQGGRGVDVMGRRRAEPNGHAESANEAAHAEWLGRAEPAEGVS
jgi:hypothetical protein